MARQTICGFEIGADAPGVGSEVVFTGTGCSIESSIVASGNHSLKVQLTSATMGYAEARVVGLNPVRMAFRIRVTARPATTARLICGTTGASRLNVVLNAAGTLSLRNNTTVLGTSATALTDTARWYHVEVVRIDGDNRLIIDGSTELTGLAGSTLTLYDSLGAVDTVADTYTAYFDDLLTDSANTAIGLARIVCLRPTADSQIGSWTGGVGGTSNLFDAIDNHPPVGTASETDTTQIETVDATGDNSTDEYRASLQSYTAAGVSGTVVNIQPIIVHGEDAALNSKTGSFGLFSNPASGAAGTWTFGDDLGALGTYPSNWATKRGTVFNAPSVTLGTAVEINVRKTDGFASVVSVCFLGLMVEYVPPTAIDVAAVAAVGAVPSPSFSEAFPAAVAAIGDLPAPNVTYDTLVGPATVAALGDVPAPSLSVSNVILATQVAAVASVPSPSVATQTNIRPAEVRAEAHLPHPRIRVISEAPAAVTGLGHLTTVDLLGCPVVNIMVQPRGGSTEVPAQVGTARNWSSVEWHRLEDDQSGAQIRIEGRAECCDWASNVRAWEHEIAVFHDNVRVWSGPVTEVNWVGDELRIDCKDRMEWMRRRKIHYDHDYGAGVDLSTIVEDLVVDGLSVDTSPNITVSAVPCGVTVDAAEGRKYLAATNRYVNDALNELARTGVDWTMLDFTLYVGGAQAQSRSDVILRPVHFEDEPEGLIDGDAFGTRFIVSGAGRGEAGDTIVGTNAIDAALEDTYGVHEVLLNEDEIRDVGSATASAESHFAQRGRDGPPFYLLGGTLLPGAPIHVNDLIPGRIFRVESEDPCKPVPQHVKLLSVTGSTGPEHSWLRISLGPIEET